MAIGQKDAVVAAVKQALPNFVPYQDIALVMLTNQQLEDIKTKIGLDICNGTIEYGKDNTNKAEVVPYARSMVMNHLKKAKELNGNQVYGSGTTEYKAKTTEKALSDINQELLPEDLKTFVKTLV